MFEARYGSDQVGRVAAMTGDVDFVQLGMPHGDAQFLEQRKLSATATAYISGFHLGWSAPRAATP
jgi:hypothetical protein